MYSSGQTLLHYRILEPLGSGSGGTVYRAFDTKLERTVALKFLNDTLASPSLRERFRLEARAAARLDHPNIGVVYDLLELETSFGIVMALYEGQSLEARLREVRERGLPLVEALETILGAARGLAAAHAKGIVHRDVKPANLFLTRGGLVKVLDFGVAKGADFGDLTQPGSIVGTLRYLPPEGLRGQGVDARADVWALGIILYETLTGSYPFRFSDNFAAMMMQILKHEPQRLRELHPELPESLELIIRKALSKEREGRYESMTAFIADVEGVLAGQSLRPPPATGTQPPTPTARLGRLEPPHVLPPVSSPLIGRAEELELIGTYLRDPECRILTLVGLGGSGKSRLALHAARYALESGGFYDGVFFVPLETLMAARALPTAIVQTLGLALSGGEVPRAQLERFLLPKQVLLVLDGFEHLMEGAMLVAELLAACPDLKCLITSRERLHLEEEWVFPVGGLSLPAAGATLEEARACSAVQLFEARAQRASLAYRLTAEALPELLLLLRLLGGSPLGIELAAAWVKLMPPSDILEEVSRDLDFLQSSARNVPERHRSLRAVFEGSWRLLSPAEAQVLARLSVFRGGFSKEAAAAVAGATVGTLADLVDKSLLGFGYRSRYDSHPLLRAFAAEKLAPPAAEEARRKHAAYYSASLGSLRDGIVGATQKATLAALEAELENIRAAWLTLAAAGDAEALAANSRTLRLFFMFRSRFFEGVDLWEEVLERLPHPPDTARYRASLVIDSGWLLHEGGSSARAVSLAEHALPLLGDDLTDAHTRLYRFLSFNLLGAALRQTGAYEEARAYQERALAEIRPQQHPARNSWLGSTLHNLARVEHILGSFESAIRHYEEALALERLVQNEAYVINNLTCLSEVLIDSKRLHEARERLNESLKLAEDVGAHYVLPTLYLGMARLHEALGDPRQAQRYAEDALGRIRASGERSRSASALAQLGRLHLIQGKTAAAERRILEALTLAAGGITVPATLDTLLALADLKRRTGAGWEAAEILATIKQHGGASAAQKGLAETLAEGLPEGEGEVGGLEGLVEKYLRG